MELAGPGARVSALAGGDTVLACTGNHDYQVWDLKRGALVASFSIPRHSYDRCASPDGKLFAVSSMGGRISLFCLATGACVEQFDTTTRCQTSQLAWSNDAKVLFAGGEDTAVRLFLLGAGPEPAVVLRKHKRGSKAVCGPAGLFATSDGAVLRVWDLRMALDPVEVKRAELAACASDARVLGFSPDGADVAASDRLSRVLIYRVSDLLAR